MPGDTFSDNPPLLVTTRHIKWANKTRTDPCRTHHQFAPSAYRRTRCTSVDMHFGHSRPVKKDFHCEFIMQNRRIIEKRGQWNNYVQDCNLILPDNQQRHNAGQSPGMRLSRVRISSGRLGDRQVRCNQRSCTPARLCRHILIRMLR